MFHIEITSQSICHQKYVLQLGSDMCNVSGKCKFDSSCSEQFIIEIMLVYVQPSMFLNNLSMNVVFEHFC